MPIQPIGGKPCSCVDPYRIESDIGGWEWTSIMIFPGIKQIIYNYIRVLWDETGAGGVWCGVGEGMSELQWFYNDTFYMFRVPTAQGKQGK